MRSGGGFLNDLAGENAGSKLAKATELEIKIINEEQFSEMIPVSE